MVELRDKMPPRSVKSAPPGKDRHKRVSAIAEIEEWVMSSKELVGGRSKEQRLLRARLMELGKERYKAKAKITYDLRKFVEKQTRMGLLNKRARPVSGQPSVDGTETKSKRPVPPHSAPPNRSTTEARKSMVQFQPGTSKCEYLTTGIVDPTDETNDGAFISLNPDCPLKENKPSERRRPSTAATPLYSLSVPSKTPVTSQNTVRFKKEDKLSKFGGKFPSLAGDPRFSGLHKSLSENYVSHTKDSVFSIIQRIESLRKPLRGGSKEARRELEIKIKQFMDEHHIVF